MNKNILKYGILLMKQQKMSFIFKKSKNIVNV